MNAINQKIEEDSGEVDAAFTESSQALQDFMELMEDTESPRQFLIWSLLSVSAALIGNNARFRSGPMHSVSANLYVILLGPPAVKKSSAINAAVSLAKRTSLNFGPTDTGGQRHGLMSALVGTQKKRRKYGTLGMERMHAILEHELYPRKSSDLFLVASELGRLLGAAAPEMADFLIDLWDGEPISYQTKSGEMIIREPLANLLGGTTPSSIASILPANYDPMNRPEIYQSAFGNMYGLFLSYTQAYYQRLFRYLEDGDWNAMGRNMAVQSGLFGINSLPGSRQFAELVGGQETGDGFLDGLYERFGPAAGSVIANGGFNQITTIFNWVDGVDVPAISLHSRGDINFRHPTSDSILSGRIAVPVGIEIISDIISGSLDILGKSIDPNVPMSARHAAEIAARHMPNRALKGTMTVLAAGGQEADAYGNLMATTQGWQEGLIRSLGLRSARQQAEIEAYFLNKQSLSIDAERMDRLRTTTRALIREGNFDRLPEVFDGYLHAGGKPWNYSRWIRDMIQDATNTRTQNQLMKYLRSPGNQHLANRILAFTGG